MYRVRGKKCERSQNRYNYLNFLNLTLKLGHNMHLSVVYKLCFKVIAKNCFPKMQSARRQRAADLPSAQVIKNKNNFTNTFFSFVA